VPPEKKSSQPTPTGGAEPGFAYLNSMSQSGLRDEKREFIFVELLCRNFFEGAGLIICHGCWSSADTTQWTRKLVRNYLGWGGS